MSDFVHGFLFGDACLEKNGDCVSAGMVMDLGKEGWVGIPHGGIGMGALLEMAEVAGLEFSSSQAAAYPLSCTFRMGGAGARVGDSVTLKSEAVDGKIKGAIIVVGADIPYITAEIDSGEAGRKTDEYSRPYVPATYGEIAGKLAHLPHYLNCFVCGVDRKLPGLKRRFHLWESPHGPVICAFAGFNDDDQESFFRFERGGFVHPMAVMALLDETMGWGGFFASGNGGVSVRLNYRILRKVSTAEKLVFFGRGEKVSGRIDKRMFFWASGCVCAMSPGGSFEKIVESSGQWYAMASLTEQMRRELIPKELTEDAFSVAQNTRV